MRKGNIERVSKETQIQISLTIEGRGRYQVSTGIQFQHVIQEANTGRHLVASASLNGERDLNLRLFADALDVSLSHRRGAPFAMPSSSKTSCSAVSNRSA